MKKRGFEIIDEKLIPCDESGNKIMPRLPFHGTEDSAGYDLFSISEGVIMPNQSVVCRTGIKSYMLKDEVLLVYSRSGMGVKHGIVLKNGTGIIDADYYSNPDNDGEIMVALRNEGNEPYMVRRGDRIAQAFFSYHLPADDGTYSNGGKRVSGFGSTGA